MAKISLLRTCQGSAMGYRRALEEIKEKISELSVRSVAKTEASPSN